MAKFTVGKGLDEYIAKLGNLEFQSPHACGMAVFEGAKIIADQVRSNIADLPVSPDKKNTGSRRDPTEVEKQGLLEGLGIAKMQNDGGFYNVKIGMNGYNGDKTKKYPQGKPNAMIARSIEAGTVFMNRNPFIAKAVRSKRKAAEAAMEKTIDDYCRKAMK